MEYAIITSVSKLQNLWYVIFKPLIGFDDEFLKENNLVQVSGEYAVTTTKSLTPTMKSGHVFQDISFVPMAESVQKMQRNYDLEGNLVGNIAKPKHTLVSGPEYKLVGKLDLSTVSIDDTEELTEPKVKSK